MSHKKHTGKNHSQHQKPATENSRRRALKSARLTGGIITGSSALPHKWSRPVIDSVILPSHADTTDDTGNLPGDVTTTATPTVNYYFDISGQRQASVDTIINESRSFAERTLNVVIPTASAYAPPSVGPIYVCLAITGSTFTGRVIREPYNMIYQDYHGRSRAVTHFSRRTLLRNRHLPSLHDGRSGYTDKLPLYICR